MRILVVEDERRIALAIKKGLEQERMAVDAVFTGDDGYRAGLSTEYDLIILDLMLPGLDGLTVCQKLRDQQIKTPILILTAKGQIEERVQGLNNGADDYLVKPFAFDELIARVRALGRRPKEQQAPVLTCHDLTLDTQTFKVERAGKEIILTPKEYALLEYLMTNCNQTVTKSQIMTHVWDDDADILPNTVEVFIKKIRRKVDDPFTKPLVTTVRGFGYKIMA